MDIVIITYLFCNYTKINRFFVCLDIITLYISPKIQNYLIDIKKKYFTKNSKMNHDEENEFKNKLIVYAFFTVFILLIIQIYIFSLMNIYLKEQLHLRLLSSHISKLSNFLVLLIITNSVQIILILIKYIQLL